MKSGGADRVDAWPYLVRLEAIAATTVVACLLFAAVLFDAPLGAPADPSRTPDPSKAPWYFVGLQELLVYFDPWMVGAALPLAITLGLVAVPFLDTSRRATGRYTLADRPLAVPAFVFGLIVPWIGLVLVATFARGPGWTLRLSGGDSESRAALAAPSRDLADLFGIADRGDASAFGAACLISYFLILPALAYVRTARTPGVRALGKVRFAALASLLLGTAFVAARIALYAAFGVRYVARFGSFGV
jgi:hypothetical protein